MKYQALRPHFFSMVGGWRVLGVGWWVGGGGVVASGVGWCMVVVVWGWVCGWILVGWVVRVGGGGVVGSGWVGDVMGSGWGDSVHLIGKIIFSLGKK